MPVLWNGNPRTLDVPQYEIERFLEDNNGIIQLVPNPWNQSKSILIIGGAKRFGTESAMYALTHQLSDVEAIIKHTGSFCIVKGFRHKDNSLKFVKLYGTNSD